MSEHSQEDLDSSLVKLEAKLPSLAPLQNTFWRSSQKFQALLSESGIPNGIQPTGAARRFTPESLTYIRLIYIRGDKPDRIAKEITLTVKTPGKEPRKLKIQSNKTYAFIWIQDFCEWFEISSTTLLKPQIKKVEIYGSTPEQLRSYASDIEDIIDLKRNIEEIKAGAKSEYAESQVQLNKTKKLQTAAQEAIDELEEQKEQLETERNSTASEIDENHKTLQQIALELKHSEKKLVETKNNTEQLSQQTEILNKNIADLKEQLLLLTTDRNLISDEYGPYVKEGNSQATTYSSLVTLPLLAIIFATYQVYTGASNILAAEYKSATDVLAAFILRIPFAAIFGLAIFYSWKLANAMIQKVFKIHSDRLTLAKLLVVARETVHSSAKDLNISDHEKFQEQAALKIEVLKSHMARDLNENFSYKPVPTLKSAATDSTTEAVNDDFVEKESSKKS